MTGTPIIRKILITNIVSLNPGDAAILWGTIEILRSKYGSDVNVIVYDNVAAVASKYYPWASFRQAIFSFPTPGWFAKLLERKGYGHWNLRLRFVRYRLAVSLLKTKLSIVAGFFLSKAELQDLNNYCSADLILSTGGTYLIENYDLNSAIYNYRLALSTGKPLGFFTQTLGPYRQPRNREAFAKIFSSARLILLRDERSKEHVVDLGVSPEKITLAADAAFVLAQPRDGQRSDIVKNGQSEQPLRIAISVRSMKFFHPEMVELYFESMVKATCISVEEFGADVVFLSTCQGIEEYWTNDADTADEVVARLPNKIRQSVTVDRQFRQPMEVVSVYQAFDAVIATRMHAAILALCAGTPTLGIAYEFKMEELFKNIGMPELVVNVEELANIDIDEKIKLLLTQGERSPHRAIEAARHMSAEAWKAEAALP